MVDQNVQSLLTVGGFAESPYLREFLRAKLESKGIRQITIDEPTCVIPRATSRRTIEG